MTNDRTAAAGLAGPGVMFLSAAIFGYFGFGVTWLTTGVNGQYLLFVALFEWTLKIGFSYGFDHNKESFLRVAIEKGF